VSLFLTKIDPLYLSDFRYLQSDDECYYLGEYTARQGFEFSATNNLVINLKKSPEYKGTRAWPHKLAAIERCAKAIKRVLSTELLEKKTLVPMPPSLARTEFLFDDRILRILKSLANEAGVKCDIRELIVQRESYTASHGSELRMGPAQLRNLYSLAPDLLDPQPEGILLLDDVITTGSHFRAAKDALLGEWPTLRVVGLFIARTVWLEDAC